MKLIHAIIHNEDSKNVIKALTKEGFFSTKLSSSGGFLTSSNSTLLIATDDNLVDKVIQIIENYSKKRKQLIPANLSYDMGMYSQTPPMEVTIGGATIFVTNIERFEKV